MMFRQGSRHRHLLLTLTIYVNLTTCRSSCPETPFCHLFIRSLNTENLQMPNIKVTILLCLPEDQLISKRPSKCSERLLSSHLNQRPSVWIEMSSMN